MNVWLVPSLRAKEGYLSVPLILSSSVCVPGAVKDGQVHLPLGFVPAQ